MIEFAEKLVSLNKVKGWNYNLATCGESIDLDGIEHNHCVDDKLMVRFGYTSKKLMDFLGVEFIERNNPQFLFYEDVAISLDGNRYAIINKKQQGQRTTHSMWLYEKQRYRRIQPHARICASTVMPIQARTWLYPTGSSIN